MIDPNTPNESLRDDTHDSLDEIEPLAPYWVKRIRAHIRIRAYIIELEAMLAAAPTYLEDKAND